ncbi:phospholipase/carboxylesterase family protein-like protein [Lophiotrema nucula]|uniref:Phospholipase/carboxylesterase family protein-like protein n=1 Tax=Lophiotrema nucula TaxID=690887 RepID=A0A6A5ZJ10_9PLEO|nr:phospholipase/carboxylesterase family protein-like protein [Lophiotrema nucula]
MPKSAAYLSPLIVRPLCEPHKTTFIVLHGRGSNAEKFSGPLLSHPVTVSSSASLDNQPQPFQKLFPHTKFIFPTASLRRATAFNRSIIHQWYDILPSPSSIAQALPPSHPDRVERDGLRESVLHLHSLIEHEVEELDGDAGRLVVMGLSQGCATMLAGCMNWNGPKLGAVVGMCGWLPMREGMADAIALHELQDQEADMFDRGSDGGIKKTKVDIAVEYMCDELGIERREEQNNSGWKDTPVFLGHGTDDEKVLCRLGQEAAEFLRGIDVDAIFRSYEGLGHWYSSNMLCDIMEFIKSRAE